MQKIVALTVFYEWWGLNVYLPNTFKSEKALWNNRLITSNRKKLKPTHTHDHKQNQALCGAFKCHKPMNKYLLKIPPWLKKGTGNIPNILCTGINKNNFDKNCKVNNECKNKTGYKCMRNKFFSNSSKQKRDNIKDGLLMFGYSNTSLKNLKYGTYVENEISNKKHSSIKNKCKYYESVFGVDAVLHNNTLNSDEKNYSLVYENDGHHDKPLADVDLKYYLENYGNGNVQSVSKSLRLIEVNNILIQLSDFDQKYNINSKNSGCLLLNYNALNGQEINIKINFGKLCSAFSNKNRQIIKALAGSILSLNCKFPVLASKATVSSGKLIKHKTVFYLSEEPKANNDLAVKMKVTKEIDRKIDSLTNTKHTNNDNSKNNESEDLNSLISSKIKNASACSINIPDNYQMTLSLKRNSSNDETGNTIAQGNKISKTKEVQNKEHKDEKLEHLNDKDHTAMILPSNISKYENRNLMNKVKMKISDTSSNDHFGKLAELPSKKLQTSKPKKINVTQHSEFNSKLLTQSNDITKYVDLNKNKSRYRLVKKKHSNSLSLSNINSKLEKGIDRTQVSENDQLNASKCNTLTKIKDRNSASESNINSKVAKIVEEGITLIEGCEKNDQPNESKRSDILEKEDGIVLSESNINSKTKQNVEEGINRNEGSEKSDQLNVNKYIILLETENRNQVSQSNINSKVSQNIEAGSQKIENNNRALLKKVDECTLSAININSKLEKGIDRTQVSENDQLNASKCITLTKIEDRYTPAGLNVNSKFAKIVEEGITITESSEKNDQLNGSKHTDLLEKEDRILLSESNINSKSKQNVEEGINRNEDSEKSNQLNINKYIILLKTENRNQVSQSNINSKVSQNIEEGSQKIENNNRALLKKEDKDTLSAADIKCKLAQKFEEGINIIEGTEKSGQLNENKCTALPLKNENENMLSKSTINPKVSQSVEQGINRTEGSEPTDQINENKCTSLSLKNENENKLSESTIYPKVSQSVEQGIYRTEVSEQTDQINENKCTALSLKNENENKLSESTINPKVSRSVEQGINRTEGSEQTDQINETKCTALSLKNENENKLSESTINPKVSQSVEQGINRTEGSEQTNQINENKCTALSLKNENENKLSESAINPKVSQSVEQGINRTKGSEQTDQINENKCTAFSLKNENENKLSESNINSVVGQPVEKEINRRENFSSVGDDDITISSVCKSSQSDQSKAPIKMKINPFLTNIKLNSLIKSVLCAARDNGIVIQQTKGSDVTNSKTDSSTSETDTQPNISQKAGKNNIIISCDTLIPENAIKNVNTSYIKEKLMENIYNLSQSKTDNEETRNEFRKRVNEGEKLIKIVNSIVDNKINNSVQYNMKMKKMKPLFRKRRTNSSVHDSRRTSAVRKSVEQNIKIGTNIMLDLNKNSKENYDVVKENSLNKKFIPDYYETKLYNCANGGSPSEIFEHSKNRLGNSMALAQLHASRYAEQKEKVVSKHLKKRVYPASLLTSTTAPHEQQKKAINIMRHKGNHLSQVSSNLRTKSKLSLHSQTKLLSTLSQNKSNDNQICSSNTKDAKETCCIPASPSSMVAQISELPRITKKQPVIVSDLKKKAKNSDTKCHNESDPNSYKLLSPSPSKIITKLTQLKVIKLKKINNNAGGLNDESEPTPCNANADQFNNTKQPSNRQNHVDRNDNLNQSLLHTNNVKQQIFKCPDAAKKCKINLSGKLQNKLDTLKELFNKNLNCFKEKWEVSNASRKTSKSTVCSSNTVLKMLQEKTLCRKNKQVKKSVNKQRYCIPSYSDVVKNASKGTDD